MSELKLRPPEIRAMRIVYNWLKEFVDVTERATDLRARLSLAGVAIDSVEESAAGPVLDAEVTANRPDCLGHYGMAREVAAIYRLPVKPLRLKLKEAAEKASDATRVEIIARLVRALHGADSARRENSAVVGVAAPAPRSDRPELDQQRGGRDELRDVRARAAAARV